MNTYIGTDMVQVDRFTSWVSASSTQLSTLFSTYECTELAFRQSHRNAQAPFLASRFAVKEAFYKAISALLVAHTTTNKTFSLKACAPHVWVATDGTWQVPQLVVDREGFTAATGVALPPFDAQVTLAHEKEYAIATVLLVG